MEIYVKDVIREEKERVILKVDESCNLWPYIIFDTTYNEKGEVSNLHRHSFIFPNHNVEKDDYVVLYSCKGKDTSFANKAGTTTHVYYWGFDEDYNVWNDFNDNILLVKVDEYKHSKI